LDNFPEQPYPDFYHFDTPQSVRDFIFQDACGCGNVENMVYLQKKAFSIGICAPSQNDAFGRACFLLLGLVFFVCKTFNGFGLFGESFDCSAVGFTFAIPRKSAHTPPFSIPDKLKRGYGHLYHFQFGF
jgi:hypothetical protein